MRSSFEEWYSNTGWWLHRKQPKSHDELLTFMEEVFEAGYNNGWEDNE
jgi:hypothetical protein